MMKEMKKLEKKKGIRMKRIMKIELEDKFKWMMGSEEKRMIKIGEENLRKVKKMKKEVKEEVEEKDGVLRKK